MSTTDHAADAPVGRIAALRARWAPGRWNVDAAALTVVTFVLVLFGLVMSFSASIVDAAEQGRPFAVLIRQVLWAAIGTVGFVVAASLDHRIWRRVAWPLLLVAFVGLLLLFVPGVGDERFGSTRWIQFGPLSLQPSELMKLAALLWVADVLERKRPRDGSLHTVPHLLIPAVPLLVLMGLLVLLQPDLGTTILLALIIGAILWVEGLPGRYVAAAAAAGLAAIGVLSVTAAYRMQRFQGWLNPEDDPAGAGFQLLQSWVALGSGGLFGVGLGSSRGKWNFLPNPETDFIFAIVGEELGLVGALVVLTLFGLLLYVGLRVAYAVPHGFGRTVAFAATAWLVGQALINIGTVIGLLPITGVTLPLVSVGGSSLVTTLVALGILVAVARSQPPPNERPQRRPAPRAVELRGVRS